MQRHIKSKMLSLCNDNILCIGRYLSNKEKLVLTATCHKINQLKHEFTYHDKVNISKIRNLSYFDQFECVVFEEADVCDECPKKVKYVHATLHEGRSYMPRHVTHLFVCSCYRSHIKSIVPDTVTHLAFGDNFNQSLQNNIPGVTNLTVGQSFKQPLDTGIPTVTHLTFGNYFDNVISYKISSSVTHLTFGRRFNQNIAGAIPDSVTHLILGDYFTHAIKNNIPASVTHLTMTLRLFEEQMNQISESITHLTLLGARSLPVSVPAHIKSVIIC